MRICLKSVHAAACEKDGHRYLIETFWPGGLDLSAIAPFGWPRELAPSPELSKRSALERWTPERFKREYWNELGRPDNKITLERLRREASASGVTFLYSGYSPRGTSAALLKEYLEAVNVLKGAPSSEMEMAA